MKTDLKERMILAVVTTAISGAGPARPGWMNGRR